MVGWGLGLLSGPPAWGSGGAGLGEAPSPPHPTRLLPTSLQLLALRGAAQSPNFVLGIGHFLPLPHPFYSQLHPSLYLLVFLWQQL